jgi:enamine deaminase RidA (YjgF/YER057c/UK114 family)
MESDPAAALASLHLTLPPAPRPAGAYSPVVVDGGLAWVSGQIASREGAIVHPGLVDSEVSVEPAQEAARLAVLQGLSALAAELGGLDHIRRVLRVGVFVASSPGFTRQHVVADSATTLLIQLFGENGRPARAAVGVARLPLNAPVEVELLVAKR